jgi:hypothetical protein
MMVGKLPGQLELALGLFAPQDTEGQRLQRFGVRVAGKNV